MKKGFNILIIILVSVFQTKGVPVDSLLSELKKNISVTLEHADTLSKQSNTYYKNQDYLKAIAFKKQALSIYKSLNETKKQVSAYEHLGIFYSDITDFEKSLASFFEGIKLVDKNKDPAQYNSLMLNIGTTYIEAGNNKQGVHYLNRVLSYYLKENNPAHLAATYSNIGVAYKGLRQLDSAVFCFGKSLQIGQEYNLPSTVAASYTNMGDVFLEKSEFKEALQSYQLALIFFKKNNDERGRWHTQSGIADVYKSLGDYSSALNLYKECITYFKAKNDLSYLVTSLKNVSDIYDSLKDNEKSFRYFREYAQLKDTLSQSETLNKMTSLQMKLDIENLEKENAIKNDLLEKEQKINTLKTYILLGILVIVLLIVFIVYNKKQHQRNVLRLELKTTQQEKGKLEEELKYRLTELESFALQIVQKNDLLNDLKKDLKVFKGVDSYSAEINNITFKINNAIKSNKDLERFSKRVDEVNASFFNTLTQKFSDLTEKEKKLCALLKLNLSSKEIAILNNVSEGAITMARYRLRKKLGIEHDENLTDFFQSIS